MNISIIVPVLNESERLAVFLEHLRERAPLAEIIVVRAAGSERISESAAKICDLVLTAGRGRAAQMNAGARAARGDVFWFVHADCAIPPNCLEQIAGTLEEPQMVGGCFRIRFPRPQLIYRVSDAVGNLAVKLFGRCYGDHGIFCRRDAFSAIGGYPDGPLFEDAEFYHLLSQRGRTRQLQSYIVPSPRRYEKIGPYRLTAAYVLLSALYISRVPIPFLEKIYNRLCLCREERTKRLNEPKHHLSSRDAEPIPGNANDFVAVPNLDRAESNRLQQGRH
jgi:rSAM/selenodomain-associated transferase 2